VVTKFDNFCSVAINHLNSHKSDFESLAKKRDKSNDNYSKCPSLLTFVFETA
jgi:hypothetical protein